MNISTTDAYGLYKKALVATFKEMVQPTLFLKSFFTTDVQKAFILSIEVQRGTEKVAVDVFRGTEGNRNSFTRSSEKMYRPTPYKEYFDATKVDLFDRLWHTDSIDDATFARLIQNLATKAQEMKNKILRAFELQCSSVLNDGTLTFINNDSINFGRKPASMVAHSANVNFATSTVNPFDVIKGGCEFMRKVGKVQGHQFNLIMGDNAMADFLINQIVLDRQNLFNMSLDTISVPVQNSVGGVYHGTITCGPYRVNIWTYPEFYQDSNNVMQPYWNPNKIVLLPPTPEFVFAHGLCDQLVKFGQQPEVGEFLIREFPDERKAALDIEVQSCALAIPVTIDKIWTCQVHAG